jgi:hypothetical protein
MLCVLGSLLWGRFLEICFICGISFLSHSGKLFR